MRLSEKIIFETLINFAEQNLLPSVMIHMVKANEIEKIVIKNFICQH